MLAQQSTNGAFDYLGRLRDIRIAYSLKEAERMCEYR